MSPSEFSQLLEKYKSGIAIPEEIKMIDTWFVYIGQNGAPLADEEMLQSRQRILARILDKSEQNEEGS